MNNYQLLRQCNVDVFLNGTVIQLSSYGRAELHIPNTQLYVRDHTRLDVIAIASGLKEYDYAFPLQWVKDLFWDKGKDTPFGVWSFDDDKYFGQFVSLDHMLKRIGEYLQQIGLTSIYAMA